MLRVSYTGDNFAGMSSVLNKRLFRKMPNSRSCDEFSELLQTVLFTMGDTGLNAVYNANADIWHVPRELEVMPRKWESLNAKAELARNASRRTLSRGSDVVRSPPFGVG